MKLTKTSLSQYAKLLSTSIKGLWRVQLGHCSVLAYSNLERIQIPVASTTIDDFDEKDVRIGNWRPLELADLKHMVMGRPLFAISGRRYGTIVGLFRNQSEYDGKSPIRIRIPSRDGCDPKSFSYEGVSVEETEVLCLPGGRVATSFDLFETEDATYDLGNIGFYGFNDFNSKEA